jgi:hypothetical protein
MENETKISELENRLSELESRLKATLQRDNSHDEPGRGRPDEEKLGPLLSAFHGEMRRYALWTHGFTIFFAISTVGCFIAFDAATTTKYQLLWISLFIVAMMQTVLIKLWYWLIWNRYSVIREVKRLEVRIAELVEKLEKR